MQSETRAEVQAPPPRHDQWGDSKQTVADLVPLLFMLTVYALLGGTAKMLRTYDPVDPWTRRAGGLLTSVFAVWVTAPWLLTRFDGEDTGIALMGIGAACWGASEIMDLAVRRVRALVEQLGGPRVGPAGE